jgi:hypothetical protein
MHFPGILQRQNGLFQRSQLVVVLKKEPEGLLERIDGLVVHLKDAKDAALLLLVLIEDIRNPVLDRVFGFLLVQDRGSLSVFFREEFVVIAKKGTAIALELDEFLHDNTLGCVPGCLDPGEGGVVLLLLVVF